MLFGAIPIADATGSIVAHTVRLRSGQVLGKGRVLTAEDVAALHADGHQTITVARLEAGDVHEDEAAAAIAAAIAGTGLGPSPVRAGRCRLYAQARGVLIATPEDIDFVNTLDESIAVATVPLSSVVEAGGLVATVKVIPFSVPRDVVTSALRALKARAPALQLASLRSLSAGVIVTHLAGQPRSSADRAAVAQRGRLARLGGRVVQEIHCEHDSAAIARAIPVLAAAGADVMLIAGAQATVDRRDVVPTAIERAGGAVEHLGMPVDPGHLLLLGRYAGIPVMGLPGCARSLRPRGVDWVLQQLAAGLEVSPRTLTRTGTGGLLERPAATPRVAAIVLAAGLSRRLGETNKLLAEVDGAPMVAHVVDAALTSGARPVIVVTGHEAERVREALSARDVIFVHNPSYAEGLASSVRTGILALPDVVGGALICLGDMPWVRAADIDALIAAFDPASAQSICVPVHNQVRGNPVLWPARYFPELAQLKGDAGARGLLTTYADSVRYVEVGADVTVDVDTPEMLAWARRGRAHAAAHARSQE